MDQTKFVCTHKYILNQKSEGDDDFYVYLSA